MLDGLFKPLQDRFWDRLALYVARLGVTPNQITLLTTVALAASSIAYWVHRIPPLFGALVAIVELGDNLDGAVARVTNNRTRLGAFLDAMTDRVKEAMVLLTLALVHDLWPPAALALVGSLLTSYAKARAGMEIAAAREPWPDLFERFERVALVCAGLLLQPFVGRSLWGHDTVWAALWALAIGTNLTAVQRAWRAVTLIRRAEGSERPGR